MSTGQKPAWMYAAWYTLHYLHPVGTKWTHNYRNIMQLFPKLLPCIHCRNHVLTLINTTAVPYAGMDMGWFMFEKHNQVNRTVGNPQFPPEKFELQYAQLYNSKPDFERNLLTFRQSMKSRIENELKGDERLEHLMLLNQFDAYVTNNRQLLHK